MLMLRAIALGVIAVVLTVIALTAQAGTPTVRPDEQLMTEIRQLRADLQEAAAYNVRAQVLIGKAQMVQSAVASMITQLSELRRDLPTKEGNLARLTSTLRNAENEMPKVVGPALEPHERLVAALRSEFATQDQDVQQRRAQERDLLNQLSAARRQQAELNASLDVLERSLPR